MKTQHENEGKNWKICIWCREEWVKSMEVDREEDGM